MDFLEMANDDRAKMGKDTCLQNAGKHVADKRDSLRSGRKSGFENEIKMGERYV